MRDFGKPNFRLLGASALVLELRGAPTLEKQQYIWRLQALAKQWTGIRECVPGMNNLTLCFDPAVVEVASLEARLLDAVANAQPAQEARVRDHEIGVRFGGNGGPDLHELCERTGASEQEIIDRFCARTYRVYFLGFQPGFAYMGELDDVLQMPRRARPRALVPAGSVAVAGSQTAIYPFASPGGWNIIGVASASVFDAQRRQPALFAAGDRVRFVRHP